MSTIDAETDDRTEGATEMGLDHAGLAVLSVDDCLHHLRTARVGRVAFVWDGEPVILPVNHGVDGDAIVFRTSPGSKLAAAEEQLPVAFEVDGFDVDRQTGWSVIVRGTATAVTDPAVTERLTTLGVWPWADSAARRFWVRIRSYEITGRRIPLHSDASDASPATD